MSKVSSSSNQELRRYERMQTEIFNHSFDAVKEIATEIAEKIIEKNKQGEPFVLGLATGSSPVKVYEELIKLYKSGKVSFKNVITFNLDEYFPMPPDALQSYVRFMKEHLFDHIDIPQENINIPDGTLLQENVYEYCQEYDRKIEALGGLDFQILGIGRTGHIGFNEPGSAINSGTRLVTLDHITKIDAASDFFGDENVPRKAITVGIGTIMKAKKIIILAWGEGKATIVKRAIEEDISEQVPATYLQLHKNKVFYLDMPAANELTRIKTPWLVGPVVWDENMIRKGVIWLSKKLKKSILKLTDRDYNDEGMGDLVAEVDSAYNINIKIFNDIQKTITGWPGGKPNADDQNRPERSLPFPKKVVIFSPHPDDDVISMGGTFIRLVDQGHDVHVAYQTSGNIAVFDDTAIQYADFVNDFNKNFNFKEKDSLELFKNVREFLNNKHPGQIDSPEVQSIKGIIRKGEAKAACRYVGIPDNNIHFMNLPFYETGVVKKKPIGEDDIRITVELLQKIKPHQIYAAGDLSDPHGTHRVCLDAIYAAIEKLKNESWMKDCYVWLYRGAWQEWAVSDIEMAIPLSPQELMRKRTAVFKHQSQKDSALFPGPDSREFWQRAEARNRNTAKTYNDLGLADYEAIEAFKRYYF